MVTMKRCAVLAAVGTSTLIANAHAIEFKFSGQVSRMIVAPDDALGSDLQHQDIGFSGSRFRITGEEELAGGYTVGFRLEQQLESNPSFAASGGNQTDGGNDDFIDNRYQDLYVKSAYGKLSMGKGDGAANGGTEADLSGTVLAANSNHQDNWGNYVIVAGATPEDNVTWDSIFVMNDGISRVNRLRYDTPSLNGFVISASLDQGNAYEIATTYNGNVGNNKISSALFYVNAQDFADDAEVIGLSASVLMENGLNATVAWSDRDNITSVGPDQTATTVKLGYKTGIHAITIDYGLGELGSTDADTVGLTYAAHFTKNIESFATIRQLDSDLANAESVDLAAVGARIRF